MRVKLSLLLLALLGQTAIAAPMPVQLERLQWAEPRHSTDGDFQSKGSLVKSHTYTADHNFGTTYLETGHRDTRTPVAKDDSERPTILKFIDTDSDETFDLALPSEVLTSLPDDEHTASLVQRVDYWKPPTTTKQKMKTGGLATLAIAGIGGLATWGILRGKARKADKKKAEAASQAAKGASPPNGP